MLQSVSRSGLIEDLGFDTPSVIGTLRGHNATITCLTPVYMPSHISYGTGDDTHRLLTTTLISADSQGWLIWWDLSTRRPLGVWRGHKEKVTTLIQLGLEWVSDAESTTASPKLGNMYGKVLSHGKDGEMKIWSLFDLENEVVKFTGRLQRRLPLMTDDNQEQIDKLWPTPPVFYELPVNTLNFSNVAILGNTLITPASMDSNSFDIYTIPLLDSDKLQRPYSSIEPLELLRYQNRELPRETAIPDSEKGRDFGIIMRIEWIDETCFAVGYESGHVITYGIVNGKLTMETLDCSHYPSPIIALVYDSGRGVLLSSSSNDFISIQTIQRSRVVIDVTKTSKKFKTHHKGIGHLTIRLDGIVGLITWDGFMRCYEYDDNGEEPLKFVFKVKKQAPSVNLNALNRSQDDKTEQEDIGSSKTRAMCLEFSQAQKSYDDLKQQGLLKWDNGMSKMLVRPREQSNLSRKWLFTGYSDGRITTQDLQ
ncbi:unnamed protein product [Kuraishia capsulata CBS 1993]|uniref:ASTRA-associated protein 1 n=1 Tax=Kuraishia capsulata CBS 1993 TaxID=1382522 RepID=W6MLQ3_9ASCO|nr:uncharacterized protein KUCA_T00001762001 [Kuraishia capsulata CBS 1993]CDK25792.1 unnamed protein product [Kuraishia capsulata CBS 1993]